MNLDQKEARRFLRREVRERTIYDREYGIFRKLVAYNTFQAILNSPEVGVVSITNYDAEAAYETEEVPTSSARVDVGFETHQAMLTGAMVLTHIRPLDDLPVVFHLFESNKGSTFIRIMLRQEHRHRLNELIQWLDALEDEVHPLKGQLLQVNSAGVGFLPPQRIKREDVALPPEILDELERGFLFLMRPAEVPKGLHHRAVLLAGPPGVGKTMACKWIAGMVSATVLWTSPQTLWTAGARPLLDLARSLRPTLLILEDLDVASGDRQGTSPLGDLLAQLDGFTSLDGIGILATTNHPEMLDHALDPRTRPGRFQRFLELGTMEETLRRQLIATLLNQSTVLAPTGDDTVARLLHVTKGFTGAQVATIIQDIELFWLWESERGTTPTVEQVLQKALHGRPSITRNLGFHTGIEAVESNQVADSRPAGFGGGI